MMKSLSSWSIFFNFLLVQVVQWGEVASSITPAVEYCQCADSMKSMTQDIVNELKAIREVICSEGTCGQQTKYAKHIVHVDVPRDCKDLLDAGTTQSGVYTIKPDSDGDSFKVYCDMVTDGGGWTVFQRRQDGSVEFNRDWADYKQGFGNLSGEFWLGLDKIYRLTNRTSNTLRVDLRDFANEARYAKFSSFGIGDEASQYTISVSGFSGTAGYGNIANGNWNGMKFSTKDRNNDSDMAYSGATSCASFYKGGWWFDKTTGCFEYYLNGKYSRIANQGIVWMPWKGVGPLQFTEMKFRRN